LEDEGSLLGLLVCDKAGTEGFDAREADALDALSRVLVGHAQRVAQLVRLRAEGGRTQMLYAATKALSMGLEREALLERFGGLLETLVPCDSWALGMREDENAPLERLAGSGYRDDAPRVLSLDRAGALAATLGQSDGAVLFNSELGAQIPAVLLEGLSGHPRHFLLAPLRLQGRLSGVLKLDRVFMPFSEEERDTAYIFASQASSTLENARLYTLHKRLATTDGLTGLYNHRYFQERLAVELQHAMRTGRPLSLALTDIDFFKKFNDTFGHQEGDVVLRKVADLLKAAGRPGKDVVCRYGGEEFVAILPDCDVVEARHLMDAMRADCAAHLSGGNGEQSQGITLSIGISTYPTAAKEQRDLIHVADEALYRAKHAGRNRVCSFKDV
jgi:diguanylate cyclase (GGDEF)-like protein